MKRTTGGRVGYESVNVRVRRNDPSSNGVSATCQRDPGGIGRRCVKGSELKGVSLHIRPQTSALRLLQACRPERKDESDRGVGWKIEIRPSETYEVQR